MDMIDFLVVVALCILAALGIWYYIKLRDTHIKKQLDKYLPSLKSIDNFTDSIKNQSLYSGKIKKSRTLLNKLVKYNNEAKAFVGGKPLSSPLSSLPEGGLYKLTESIARFSKILAHGYTAAAVDAFTRSAPNPDEEFIESMQDTEEGLVDIIDIGENFFEGGVERTFGSHKDEGIDEISIDDLQFPTLIQDAEIGIADSIESINSLDIIEAGSGELLLAGIAGSVPVITTARSFFKEGLLLYNKENKYCDRSQAHCIRSWIDRLGNYSWNVCGRGYWIYFRSSNCVYSDDNCRRGYFRERASKSPKSQKIKRTKLRVCQLAFKNAG